MNASLDSVSGAEPVSDGETLRVEATVNGSDGTDHTVRANASTFGAGTLALNRSNGTWTGTFDVNRSGVAGDRPVRVTATNNYNNTDSERTNAVFLDTAPPDANVGPNVTVTVGTNVSFDADAATDESRIVRYDWAFGDGETASGMTAVHTYESPDTYAATLTVTDAANNTATATRHVTVTEAEGGGNGTDGGADSGSGDSDGGAGSGSGDNDGGADSDSGGSAVSLDGSDGDSDIELEPDVEVHRSYTGGNDVYYDIDHANAGEGLDLDVPAGDRLDQLRAMPIRDGSFSLGVTARATPPNGTPAVDSVRAVRPVSYWNVSHDFGERAVREPRLRRASRPRGDSLGRRVARATGASRG